MQDTKDTLPNKEQKFLFGSPNVSSLSFQSIASSSLGNSPFGKKPTSGNSPSGFPGLDTKLLTTPHSADRDESTTEEDHEGEHFEPIIPLPEKIDVKTGEENEEVMFSHRAKLYRFVAEDKQWKERGVGDIKLLKNRRSGKIRVLMRRNQVLKICANHQITAEMKLKPNAGSEKSWVWSTMADFSEQECRAERLAVRFKSEDIAKQFKEKFEECQEMLKNSTLMESRVQPKSTDAKEDLVAKFKPTEGSWECSVCMVNNDSDKVACAACGSVKGGAEPSQGQKEGTKPLFAFGSEASSFGGRLTFGSGGTNQGGVTKPAFIFGGSKQTSNPSSGVPFTFGSLKPGGLESEQQSEEINVKNHSLNDNAPDEEANDTAGDMVEKALTREELLEEKYDESKNQSGRFTFGSDGTNQGGVTKPAFIFGGSKQTSNPSSGVPFTFGSLKPGGLESEQQSEEINVKNHSLNDNAPDEEANDTADDTVACAACGSVKGGAEPSQGQKEGTKPLFGFGSGASFSGGGFRFGPGGINQGGDTKPAFTYGGLSKTKKQFSGFSFSFGTLKQGGIVSDQQSKATKSSLSSLFEPKPGNKAGISKHDHERQEKTKNQTSFKAKKEETKSQQAEKGIMAKLKADKRLWECSVCMVKNDIDKVACTVCGSVKGGAEPSQGQKEETKPIFVFGSGASSSGEGFTFGSGGANQGGDTKPAFTFGDSKQTSNLSSGFSLSFGSVTSGGLGSEQQSKATKSTFSSLYEPKPGDKAGNDHECQERHECHERQERQGFTFGLSGKSQKSKTKPVFNSGGLNQTPYPDTVFSFKPGGGFSNQHSKDTSGSLSSLFKQMHGKEADNTKNDHERQEMLKNRLLLIATKDEKKIKDTRKDNIAKFKNTIGSWKCEICMVNNVSDKVECAACGSVKSGAEVIKEQKQDSKSLFTFGFGASSSGGVFSFGSGGTSQGDSKPVFTFGSQN